MADGNDQSYSDDNSDGFTTDSDGTWATADGDTTGDYDDWDWRKIMAAICGGSAYTDDTANTARAREYSDPQTIQTAADTLHYTQQVLDEAARSISAQTEALTGEHGPWQGQAAQALNKAMSGVAQQTQRMADRLSGGVTGDVNVPQMLADNAQHLREAIAKVADIDNWYANQAVKIRPDLQMDNGLVMVSKDQQIVQMMSTDMRKVLNALARHYTAGKGAVAQPSSPTDPNNSVAPGSSTGTDTPGGDGDGSDSGAGYVGGYGYGYGQGGTGDDGSGSPYGQDDGTMGYGSPYGQDDGVVGDGSPYGDDDGIAGVGSPYGQDDGTMGYGSPYGQDDGTMGYGSPYGQGDGTMGYGSPYGQGDGTTGVGSPYGPYGSADDEYYGGADQDPYGSVAPGGSGAYTGGGDQLMPVRAWPRETSQAVPGPRVSVAQSTPTELTLVRATPAESSLSPEEGRQVSTSAPTPRVVSGPQLAPEQRDLTPVQVTPVSHQLAPEDGRPRVQEQEAEPVGLSGL
ncbi:hypothetical protein ABZ832_17365 [Streptantibioticus parmotrematis]|uniref:hypothetical protein n=1 Tax=Streptantibioticus parmotrematis TaxID=2873249 RepID=UPI0033CCCA10